VFLGALGLAIDLGHLRYMKWRMQAAADAAAVAGAHELMWGTWQSAAWADSKRNGFENGVNGVTVTVNSPPTQGNCAAQTYHDYCVEVIVSQNQPTFFMRIMGVNTAMVSARAVGILWSGPNCIYALNATANGAFQLTPNGGYAVQANCGVVVDSSSSSALDTNSNTLTLSGGGSAGIVGGCASPCNVTPPPTTGIIPVADPLAYLPEPTPTGTVRANPNITAPGNYTLQPGIYSNGITIGYQSGRAGPDVTFAPGNYYITGGTFSATGPNTDNDNADGLAYRHPNLHGNGVFFYVGRSAQVAILGGGNGTFINSYGGLIAQTTGTYAGILFFQSRFASSYTARVSSGHGDGWTGALYFPTAALRYANSRPNAAQYMIMVAQTINMYRDMTTVQMINYDTSGLPNGSPIRSAVLTE
jgi:hypothetical protein